jgi:uncharacterized repeat protein (TIGR03943 family)
MISSLKKQLKNVALLLLGVALVALYWSDRLSLYIRPDYHLFTYVMGIILLVVGYAGFWISEEADHGHSPQKRSSGMWGVLGAMFFVGLWAYLVFGPRTSLSARAAMNRGINQNAASGTSSSTETEGFISPLLSLSQTDSYTLADWTRLLRRDPEPSSHEGKTVKLEGFVQPLPGGTYALARFIVSCCVVDASPIALEVDAPQGELLAGQWLRLEGRFAVQTRDGQRVLVVVPEKVESIPEPALPYLY